MKIVVANAFFDKNTGEPYNSGEIFESTDKDRIKELRDGGYLATVAVGKANSGKDQQQVESSDSNQDPKTENTANKTESIDAISNKKGN